MEIKNANIIVSLDNGKVYQTLLTKEQQKMLIDVYIPMLFENNVINLHDNALDVLIFEKLKGK